MIRPATKADIPAILPVCIEALMIDQYQELVISPRRIQALLEECVESPTHFAWVSEEGGKIMGGLGAIVTPSPVYERSQASIWVWYCKHPGDGAKLLRKFLRWIQGRPLIKQVLYTGERKADPRLAAWLSREGFQETLPLFVMTR